MEENNALAITSLVLGILSVCCCGFPLGIAAIVCALVDRSRRFGFEGLGLAGFILGLISCIMGLASYIYSLVLYGSIFAIFDKIFTEMETEMQILSLFRFF